LPNGVVPKCSSLSLMQINRQQSFFGPHYPAYGEPLAGKPQKPKTPQLVSA